MSNDPTKFLSEVFSLPFGQMISSVGEGVAEAQAALDRSSIEATVAVYGEHQDEGLNVLRQIGYQPNYYGLQNVHGKLKLALSIVGESTPSGQRLRMYSAAVNPTLQNKYSYSAEAAAEVSFDIVPIPPTEFIRKIPDLVGMSVETAEDALEQIGLNATFVDEGGIAIDPDPTGVVDSSTPAAGAITQLDSEVTLTIATLVEENQPE